MATPTLTLGHGEMDDCSTKTGWGAVQTGGNIINETHTVLFGDVFKLDAECTDALDEYIYIEKDVTNFSSTVYNNFLVRYYTSAASNGLGAQVEVIFDDVTSEYVFGSTPQFSPVWTTATGTLTTGKTVDKIRLYAKDEPDSVTGAHTVYFDFILFYNTKFVFPYVNGEVTVNTPQRYVDIPIPGRVGDITQYLGAENPVITVSGDMQIGSWNTPKGETLHRACVESHAYPWQWFTSDRVNCKVTLRNFSVTQPGGSDTKPRYTLNMKLYSLSCGSNYEYFEWLGLP